MDDNATHGVGLSPLTVVIIAIICAAAVLLTYHCVIARWCYRQEPDSRHRAPQLPVTYVEGTPPSSMENSIAELIPSYKYTKDIGLVSRTQDGGTCSVCLCEFMDGELVRVLPECLHPFHVTCIDTWLHSHRSCPLCRTGTPTPPR